MSRPTDLASRAAAEGTSAPFSLEISAHIGGAQILTPWFARCASSARSGSSSVTLASSRNTACLPKSGSDRIQYSTSSRSKDCGHTRLGGTPAALYSSIIFCA
jgi:hypothetical protein